MQQRDKSPTIYSATRVCLALFDAYLKDPQVSKSRRYAAAELLGRFNGWAAYVGAVAPPKACLDARLVDNDDVRDMFLELLAMVQRNINQDLLSGDAQTEIHDEKAGSDSDDSSYLLGLDAVGAALDRLHSLAIALRQAANTRSKQEAVSNAHGAQTSEELCYINAMKVRFPHASNGLLEQVGRSIHARGKAIYYQQRHNQKLAVVREEPQPELHVRETQASRTPQETSSFGQGPVHDNPMPIRSNPFSETNHSGFQTEQFRAIVQKPKPPLSQISRGSSIRENDMEGFSYPQKPRSTGTTVEPPCPLCSEPLKLAGLTDKKWREHVDLDVETYVCVSEDCSKELRFFSSFHGWEDHMHTAHGLEWAWQVHTVLWQCDLDHAQTAGEDDNNEFYDKDDFLQHLSTTHDGSLSRPQILVQARRNKTFRRREPFTCPFCDCVPDEKDFIVSQKPYTLLAKHIARHLKAVAFFSLNYLDLGYDGESSVSRSVDEVDAESLGKVSDRDDTFDDVPTTIRAETEVRVEGLIFSFPGDLKEDDIVWPPPGLITELTGPDTTLENFAAASRGIPQSALQVLASGQPGDKYRTEPSHSFSTDDLELLKKLCLTDPRRDKERIEKKSGGLIRDVYLRLLDITTIQRWLKDPLSHVFWISGDHDTGKTMLLCGIINELESLKPGICLCYSFCQHFGKLGMHTTDVFRELIYMLVLQRPALISYVRKKGKKAFADDSISLTLLEDMLLDKQARDAILLVDSIDISQWHMLQMLRFISRPTHTKWIISSQVIIRDPENMPRWAISRLEINQSAVSDAVAAYIRHVAGRITHKNGYNVEEKDAIAQHLTSNANGSLAWASMVCQVLAHATKEEVLEKARTFPKGVSSLYRHVLATIDSAHEGDICKEVLAIVATVYEPITLAELCNLCQSLSGKAIEDVRRIIQLCAPFLELRDDILDFAHISAKDFLVNDATHGVFPFGIARQHALMASRSLAVLSRSLMRNICDLKDPGSGIIDVVRPDPDPTRPIRGINDVVRPDPDPTRPIRYACLYWANHLEKGSGTETSLQDGGKVHGFLKNKFLYWLEALSLFGEIDIGRYALQMVERLLHEKEQELRRLVDDAQQFVVLFRDIIAENPLQTYVSALLFCPTESTIRKLFKAEEPAWVKAVHTFSTDTTGNVHMPAKYGSYVRTVRFSPDGRQLASCANDKVAMLWDTASGEHIRTFKGHAGWVMSVAFSTDGQRLATGSNDNTVKLWNTASGECIRTLRGHDKTVQAISFSPGGHCLASASSYKMVKLWDTFSGACLLTLEISEMYLTSIGFSPNGSDIAVGSSSGKVTLWDTSSGACIQTLLGHDERINLVVFSPDGSQVAAGADDDSVKVWDVKSGDCTKTVMDYGGLVAAAFFTSDGMKYGIRGNGFATKDGREMVRLPSEWRPRAYDIFGKTIGVGCESGKVYLLTFMD